jgi:uncharacterized protein (DUF58 family)
MAIKRQALVWGSIFLAIVAFILHVSQLFTMAAVLACLPLVTYLLGRNKLRGLQVGRTLPTAVTAGERVSVDLTVSNEARTRRIFFVVSDQVPAALEPRGHFDLPVAMLGPGEQTRVSYELTPPRRGLYRLGPVKLLAPDAIALRQYNRDLNEISELLVYPQSLALPYLWPAAVGGHQPLKPRRRLRGEGDDLYGIRDYVPGDDPRRIDWKTTARRAKLAVIEYERPESLEAMIVLDLERRWHAGKDDRDTLEYAISLAATLLEQAYERGSSVGLIAVGGQDFSCGPLTEENQRLRLYEALARAQADGASPLYAALAAHEDLLTPRCAVAVLSPSPEAGALATYLRGTDHSVAWFALQAPTFDAQARADYSDLAGLVSGARCRLHLIRGDVPLEANWRAGVHYATR